MWHSRCHQPQTDTIVYLNSFQLDEITKNSFLYFFVVVLPLIMQIDFILSLVNLRRESEREGEKGEAINLKKQKKS